MISAPMHVTLLPAAHPKWYSCSIEPSEISSDTRCMRAPAGYRMGTHSKGRVGALALDCSSLVGQNVVVARSRVSHSNNERMGWLESKVRLLCISYHLWRKG